MAKFYGSMVKTGKVGGSVFTVSKGVTIEKQYQPIVNNPSTTAQVTQRTKFKLVSQLSAALQTEIAFVGSGLTSSRNMFVKDIFQRDAVTYDGGIATILPENIRLTGSRIAPLSDFSVTRAGAQVTVSATVSQEFREKVMGVRMVFVRVRGVGIAPDITPYGNTVIPDAATGVATFAYNIAAEASVVVYAYAFWPQAESAITKYGELIANGNSLSVTLERMRREVPLGMEYSATYYGAALVD